MWYVDDTEAFGIPIKEIMNTITGRLGSLVLTDKIYNHHDDQQHKDVIYTAGYERK